MREFYKENRQRLIDRLADNSAAAVFSGRSVKKIGDEDYPFTPNAGFYYLTGLDEPNAILLLLKKDGNISQTLFIEPFDEEKARWTGAVMSKDKAADISGISNIQYNYAFEEYISGELFKNRTEYMYIDLENRKFDVYGTELDFANKISRGYPHISIKNLYNDIAELRRLKYPQEIDRIKKAVEITGEGIVNMMRHTRSGMYEYQAEAYFDYTLKSHGVQEFAFKSIVASGKNAAVLHYSKNNSLMEEGSLVLCDVGAKFGGYSGDITRTFPVSGKFSERQRRLYEIVLRGQELIISCIRPGIPFKSLNEKLIKYYEKVLCEIGLIDKPEQVKKYYWHGVSHMLGLETHDAGRHNEGMLEAGMVLTVEPGLYIAEEGIGIRIEDDVVVTDDGCRIIFDGIPKTVEEIEAVMSNG